MSIAARPSFVARLPVLLQWLVLGSVVGIACGGASAAFLWALEVVTRFRVAHETIVYALPVAGLLVGLAYERLGKPIQGGNDLVIDTIHDGASEIPVRMAPLVALGTVLTHLFGGSAGREGTAVQMGASLTDFLSHRLRVAPAMRVQLLAAGVAGGFGSVFGTPVAGAVFGIEFVVVGSLEYGSLAPALVAAVVGDLTTRGLGIEHATYPTLAPLALSVPVCLQWGVFALAIAVLARVFVEATHWLKKYSAARLGRLPVRMAVGGLCVVLLWKAVGTSDYLGLGVPTILRAFEDPMLPRYAFAAKLVFTAVTLGAGFLGGEVTPLFFIGAAAGNVLARALGLPLALGAGVGMASMFAAASNTPLALSIMAVELLGANAMPHVVIVCVVTYVLAGRRSIYASQRRRAPRA